ncbi:MAG: trypsin-like peptidase domain-containing protein [Sedimentisphaerales bacterium]|nr:trypsin-like peptidase domain-containing protein [Sedimentisphaerales bacterium]
MRKILPVFIVLLYSSLCAAEQADMSKSVVMIQTITQSYNYTTPWKQESTRGGVGSGFIIEGNRILTNAHNIADNRYIIIRKENIAKKYPATVEFVGHDCDLALLKVSDESFFADTVPLELGELPKVNSTVSTYGFPMGGTTHISVTEGVVSRIQTDVYAHSRADAHLVVQTDAAINPGNSGGCVIQDGKVIGVAFQGIRQADNIGYMIPTTVIKHFLKDIKDGAYDGFGTLGVMLYPGLHNESYREFLKVPPDAEGIVVTSVILNSSAEKTLQEDDLITKVDDYDVDNDGMIMIYGSKHHMSEVIEQKQIGEKAEITFWRGGEKKTTELTIQLNRPVFEYARLFDDPPGYICFAGLTFVSASRNFLETWGADWMSSIPHTLRYLFTYSQQLNTDKLRKEYVILSEILPDEINSYAEGFINTPLESINGFTIRSLDDVKKAFENQDGEFYVLKFMNSDIPLSIETKKAHQKNELILKKYNVPTWAFTEEQI